MKSLYIIGWLFWGAFAVANSEFHNCISILQNDFQVSRREAKNVCYHNSSPQFVRCMSDKANTTTMHIMEAAPICSRQIRRSSNYNPGVAPNPRAVVVPRNDVGPMSSCEYDLQMLAYVEPARANQVCSQDSSVLMQECIIDLATKARFLPEHSIQYCQFASRYYRSQIPQFKSCVINEAKKGYDSTSAAQTCHTEIFNQRTSPRVQIDQTRQQRAGSADGSGSANQQGRKDSAIQSPVPKNKTGADVVKQAAPVIKVQESSKPIVKDQPLNSESNENAESLPID